MLQAGPRNTYNTPMCFRMSLSCFNQFQTSDPNFLGFALSAFSIFCDTLSPFLLSQFPTTSHSELRSRSKNSGITLELLCVPGVTEHPNCQCDLQFQILLSALISTRCTDQLPCLILVSFHNCNLFPTPAPSHILYPS